MKFDINFIKCTYNKIAVFFLLVALFSLHNNLMSQNCNGESIACLYGAPQISFKDKAPFPWAIDGNITDWETLLGPRNNDPLWPYCPPENVSSNMAIDYGIGGTFDLDKPDSASDLRFSAFIHDDYNVHFYFRRLKKGNAPNEFFYFCDVNADGYMNLGEPVFHAEFSYHTISSLKIGVYIPDFKNYYTKGKGNEMVKMVYDESSNFLQVDSFPLPGKVIDIFNSASIPQWAKLNKNEIFSAAITENGFGVEFAVPWRYLKNPLQFNHHSSNKRNTIFTYKIELQPGKDCYNAKKVTDNMGNCCNSFVTMNDVNLDKNISNTTLKEGSSYRFKITYTNPTNVAENVGIEEIIMDKLKFSANGPIEKKDFNAKVYADLNCNNTVDAGEPAYIYSADFSRWDSIYNYNGDSILLTPDNEPDFGIIQIPPLSKSCIIIDVFMPANTHLISGDFRFESSVEFNLIVSYCHAGGRTINPVGTVKTKVGKKGIVSGLSEDSIIINNLNSADVNVYPNPNNGSFTVYLSSNDINSIVVYDVYGKIVKQLHETDSGRIQINNLKRGFYFLKVTFKNGKTIAKKIMVNK